MKRFLELVLALSMLVSLTAFSGCDVTIIINPNETTKPSATEPSTTEPPITEPPATEPPIVSKPSEGLEFTAYGDYCIVSGIGTCKDTNIVIPDTYNGLPVKEIGMNCFNSGYDIESIIIPDSVTIIKDGAFAICTSLTSIYIPDSVTSIGELAFQRCESLTSINIPDSVTCIEGFTFYSCKSLKSIRIPDSVASIGSYAFYGCENLNSISYTGTVEQWHAMTKEEGTYRWNEGVPATEIICADGKVSSISLTSGKWVAKHVVGDAQSDAVMFGEFIYDLQLDFDDSTFSIAYGDNMDAFDSTLQNELFEHGSSSIELINGKYYYWGRGDGGSITYITNGNTVNVNCEGYFYMTLRRTSANQMTIIESDGLPTGIVLAWCED